jgi:NitT/TauT family transport system substrate-binding protein
MAKEELVGIGRRKLLVAGLGVAAAGLAMPALAQGREQMRVGVPTKAYWPTIIALATLRQKLFEKTGLAGEMTVYRSGAECFEALAAGAADIILAPPSLVAAGLRRGVRSKLVAGAQDAYYGWHLMVRQDSPVTKPEELAGKKVGITAAGSGSDLLAQWTMQDRKIDFTRVPVGGGGLVPNLRSRNLDAAVIYSPLTFQLMRAGQARSLIDFTTAVPRHCVGGWIVPDKLIEQRPQAVQGAVNALYGGLAWLRANREGAIALIAENNEIPPEIATIEYEETILKLRTDGGLTREEVATALELSRLGGMSDLAPAEECFTTAFRPTPTAA